MNKFNRLVALSHALERQVDPKIIKELVGILLCLIAAVRCFLAEGHHSECV